MSDAHTDEAQAGRLTDAEIRDPWSHLKRAERRIAELEAQLQDYADAQALSLPSVNKYVDVLVERLPSTDETILTINPNRFDVRFRMSALRITDPENIAREVQAAMRRYADDLTRKVAEVAGLNWFR